jgi:hypothetical protein
MSFRERLETIHLAGNWTSIRNAADNANPASHRSDDTNSSESIMAETQLLEGSCHCGAVRLTLPSKPEEATRCNCSLCRRVGGLWAYYEFGTVRIQGHPENTAEYIWGDKTLRNLRCKTCGCVTHWEPLAPEPGSRHGVNLNNFDPQLQESVRVRRFDGADTWTFLD